MDRSNQDYPSDGGAANIAGAIRLLAHEIPAIARKIAEKLLARRLLWTRR
jgi:hypothetical protein